MNKDIIAVALPDRGAGNDPEPLGLAFHHQRQCKCIVKLLPLGSFTSLHTHDAVSNTGVISASAKEVCAL